MTSLSPSESPAIKLMRPHHDSLRLWLSLAGASVFFHVLALWAVLPWMTQVAADAPQLTAVEMVELPPVQAEPTEDAGAEAIASSTVPLAPVSTDLSELNPPVQLPLPEIVPIESTGSVAPAEDKLESVLSPIYNPTLPSQELTPPEVVPTPNEPDATESPPSMPLATPPASRAPAPLPSSAPESVPNLQPEATLPPPPGTGTRPSSPVDDATYPQNSATTTAETLDLPMIGISTEQTYTQLTTRLQVVSTAAALVEMADDRPETLPSPISTEQVFNPDPTTSQCLITPDTLPLLGQPVDFKVVVQPDGHVADAILQPGNHPLNQAYVDLAACILRESWQFTPATSGSEAVMSDDLIISITVDRI